MTQHNNARENSSSSKEDEFNEIARRVKHEKASYIGLVPVFMDMTCTLSASLISAPFRGSNGAPTYRRAVSYAFIREILNSFTVAEGQMMTISTDKAYRRVAKSRNWTAHTIGLEHDAKGHWLGHSDAKYVMIYFHGGGYVVSATSAHIKYQFELQKAIRRLGHDFSIFSLSYTLAPKAVYPMQLAQAAAALRFLVKDQGRDPETILLGGDSAGANLATALLSHLAHPHWGVETVDLGGKMLRGALMISPWVAFRTDDDSFRRNAKSDFLTTAGLNRASNTYIGPGGRHDNYTEPVRAPPEWWSDVANVVSEIMIWGGGGEVLIDGIRRFKRNVKTGFNLADVDGSAVTTSELGDANFYIGSPERSMSPIRQENRTVESDITASPMQPMEASTTVASYYEDEYKYEEDRGGERNTVSSLEGAERVLFLETPRMAHEEMILDYLLRIKGKGDGAIAIEGWLHGLLKEKGKLAPFLCFLLPSLIVEMLTQEWLV
jgi:acetyl esterase/lipase